MRITKDHIEYLKANVPLDVVFTALGYENIKVGMNLCPFHDDRNPSLSVQEQYYNCFSSVCKARGDAFTLIMKTNKCSFLDSIKFLEELL